MSDGTGGPSTPGTDRPVGRPYHSPQLIVYGTIRQITESVNNVGAKDGGVIPGFKKTR